MSCNTGQDRHSPCPPGACTPGTYTTRVAFPQRPLRSQCSLLWNLSPTVCLLQHLLLKSNPIQMPPLPGHLHWRSQQQCHPPARLLWPAQGVYISHGELCWSVLNFRCCGEVGGFFYKTTISGSAGWFCPSLALQCQASWHIDAHSLIHCTNMPWAPTMWQALFCLWVYNCE